MMLSWLGAASMRIASTPLQEEIVIITDPFAPKELGLKRGKLAADVVTISAPHHPLHNARDEVRGKNDQPPFVIATPGECELKGAMIYGIPAQSGKGDAPHPCTLFLFEAEGITVLHLGLLGQGKLTDAQLERFAHIDVLCVPAGDPEGLTVREAAAMVEQIEPRIVVPIAYEPGKGRSKFQSADKLIKELGLEAEEPIAKLKIARKDLPAEETRLVLLSLE